jgi:GNAT superfamily N-acetyltransferase
LAEWLALYAQWSERFPDLQHRHRELLERITLPTLYAALYVQDTCVACGLGVLDHEALGLFDIVTAPAQRRQGYGTQLVMAILAWGKQRGAQYAHLQVVQDNLAAQQMYTRLGFHHYYHYWYRVRRS